jgi:sulfite reductase (ferredoxin)
LDQLYNLPQEVLEDVELYRLEVERFKKGDTSTENFKPFRVSRGIYAQRGQKSFMMRIKVPGGGLTPEQIETIATLSKEYGNGIPHITTRQDFQLHDLKQEDTAIIMEKLFDIGLTCKGGGGNTIRNITACPDAGVCRHEAFDVYPYATAFTEFFLSHPKSGGLPRKFKIAFSGCVRDSSLATITDVGFIAKKRTIDGIEKKGFAVYAAGGMGAGSRVGTLLEEFIAEEEAINVAESLLLLFDKHGNRKDKRKARLRFVMAKLGKDAFLELYRENLQTVRAEKKKPLVIKERPQPKELISSERKDADPVSDASFNLWRKTNVSVQKNEGFYYAKIRLPLGDISAEALKHLSKLIGDFGEGTLFTTIDQNIVVRWLKGSELYPFYLALKKSAIATVGAGGPADITSCPGASTCNLGICLSRNLATALSEQLEGSGLPLHTMNDVKIKISGCPNSCSQHPIAPIGLYGAAKRGSGRMAPHYNIVLGGRVEEGKTTLGKDCGFVPAKKVPELLIEFLTDFNNSRKEDEDYYSYLDRRGMELMAELVKKHPLPSYEEDGECYKDWGADEEFSLSGLGAGECGAGVSNMIESDIEDGKRYINKAAYDLKEGRLPEASSALSTALGVTTKSLIVAKGVEAEDDYISVTEFERLFINTGLVDESFAGLKKRWAKYLSGLLDAKGLEDEIHFMEKLSGKVNSLYENMDANMKFEGEEKEDTPKKGSASPPVPEENNGDVDVSLDLRGVKCPINYVKAKIRMEMMQVGQTIQILLDDGEPIQNVPKSLADDGQEILKQEQLENYYELLVKKAA